MCTNYAPVQRQILREIFGVEPPPAEWKPETWPDYAAPIVRADEAGRRDSVLASFGLVPRSRIPKGVRPYDTMNARSETVGEKRTFSGSWTKGHLCLIPATAVYEPNYEGGPKSTRYRIWLSGEPAFGVAGLWRDWPDGAYSFTMLTVNADKHPVMNRMHAPGKEKRSVVIVPRQQWDDWLACRDPEVARTFMNLFPAEAMATEPAPIVRRTKERPQDTDPGLPL
ncbi:putative SOS response-associated peptidase YedK [Cupriavidus alkaliphilus]|uniref:SOS response-associated peptidase n=1 Tax=Cupriavidus alkaliphilus TaxID=942866 RepID=UPI000DE704AB|nr:SOS response-associated peptidase family protein [Cupriavidus alkaliphilus]PVY81036.1 putative SOS response-associated peptidase YedK [Cupriavidus alkaliphilus]